jgi:hypothetical protein
MKRRIRIRNWIAATVAVIVIPLSLFLFSVLLGDGVDAEALGMVEGGINRAVLQCYALEGFYPHDLSYVVERYGVTLNDKLYFVDYVYRGSNLKPDITVLPL